MEKCYSVTLFETHVKYNYMENGEVKEGLKVFDGKVNFNGATRWLARQNICAEIVDISHVKTPYKIPVSVIKSCKSETKGE